MSASVIRIVPSTADYISSNQNNIKVELEVDRRVG